MIYAPFLYMLGIQETYDSVKNSANLVYVTVVNIIVIIPNLLESRTARLQTTSHDQILPQVMNCIDCLEDLGSVEEMGC